MTEKIKPLLRGDEHAIKIVRVAALASLLGALAMLLLTQSFHPRSSDVATGDHKVIRLEPQFLSDQALRGLQDEVKTMQNEVSNCMRTQDCN